MDDEFNSIQDVSTLSKNAEVTFSFTTYRSKHGGGEGLKFHIEIALSEILMGSTSTGGGRFHRGAALENALHVEHLGGGPQPLRGTGPRHGQRRFAGVRVHRYFCTALTISFILLLSTYKVVLDTKKLDRRSRARYRFEAREIHKEYLCS